MERSAQRAKGDRVGDGSPNTSCSRVVNRPTIPCCIRLLVASATLSPDRCLMDLPSAEVGGIVCCADPTKASWVIRTDKRVD